MNGMNRRQAYTLYFCHLLSAWNARCYEFSSVSISSLCMGLEADENGSFSFTPRILEDYVLCPICIVSSHLFRLLTTKLKINSSYLQGNRHQLSYRALWVFPWPLD